MMRDAFNEIERARDALYACSPNSDRPTWFRKLSAAKAAGIDGETAHEWSAQGENYRGSRDFWNTWKSIERDGAIGAGTLFYMAKSEGMDIAASAPPFKTTARPVQKAVEPPRKPRPSTSAAEVWARCIEAPESHPYIVAKQGTSDGLRLVPIGDPLRVNGEQMTGWLAVPVTTIDGGLISLQFIAPPDVAAALKAKGKPGKVNLPGADMAGVFIVGELEPGAPVYVVEGIGAAWACWKATGRAAVVCFGWGNVQARAAELQSRDAATALVIVPDVGKEAKAEAIARELVARVACMPDGWPSNSDVCDMALRDGFDALEALLSDAKEAPAPEQRYKLLCPAELDALPPLA